MGGSFNQLFESPVLFSLQTAERIIILEDGGENKIISEDIEIMVNEFSNNLVKYISVENNNINDTLYNINKTEINLNNAAMFLFLNDDNVQTFVTELYEYNNLNDMDIYAFNIHDSVILKDSSLWEGIYIISTYVKDIDTILNRNYLSLLDSKIGNSIKIINPYSLNIYDTLQLFREVTLNFQPTVDFLLSKFYSLTITSLIGTLSLNTNNYMDKSIFVCIFILFS